MKLQLHKNDDQGLFRLIELITDKAKLRLDQLEFDNNELRLIIFRYPVSLETRGFCKSKLSKIYNKNKRISSEIRIANVSDYSLNVSDETIEITILFGLQILSNKIYLSSAEEDGNGPICQLDIFVTDLNIEINDLD